MTRNSFSYPFISILCVNMSPTSNNNNRKYELQKYCAIIRELVLSMISTTCHHRFLDRTVTDTIYSWIASCFHPKIIRSRFFCCHCEKFKYFFHFNLMCFCHCEKLIVFCSFYSVLIQFDKSYCCAITS
jgi:hypothetical protein